MKFCTYLSYASFDAFDNETLSGSFMFVEFQLQNLEFFLFYMYNKAVCSYFVESPVII